MRTILINYLIELAAQDPLVYLVVGDVGFSVVEKFQERFPDRFINAGVAEQNMIGYAAGLAMAGKKVYVYSIVPFACMRCFEQIRIDVCYQNLPVTIIGNGGGFSYGQAGVTHHALEDVAIMRALPGMTVIAPGSKRELQEMMPAITQHQGPMYLRLATSDELCAYPDNMNVQIGKAIEIIPHDEILFVATGNALDLGYQVVKQLELLGVDAGLVSMPTIKPLDVEFFVHRKNRCKAIFTLEEHSVIGGLGDAVGRLLAEQDGEKIAFQAFGVQDFYFHEVGSRNYLKEKSGLTWQAILPQVIKKLDSINVTRAHVVPRGLYHVAE